MMRQVKVISAKIFEFLCVGSATLRAKTTSAFVELRIDDVQNDIKAASIVMAASTWEALCDLREELRPPKPKRTRLAKVDKP